MLIFPDCVLLKKSKERKMNKKILGSFINQLDKLREAMAVAYLNETGHSGVFASQQIAPGVTEYFMQETPSDLPYSVPNSIPQISLAHLKSRAAFWLLKTNLPASKAKIIVDLQQGFWIEPR
jgi:hypothetical protein